MSYMQSPSDYNTLLNVPEGIIDKFYNASAQVITSGGTITIAHGMLTAPKFVSAFLINQVTEHGYIANDVVSFAAMQRTVAATNGYGASIQVDGTNIKIRFGNEGSTFQWVNDSTGAPVSLTNSSWKIIIRVSST